MDDNVPTPVEVKAQLRRILQNEKFAGTSTVSALLERLVHATLNGEEISETSLGIEIWNRPPQWVASDNDGIVRQNKRNMVARLQSYNNTFGGEDPVIIELLKGYKLQWRYNPRCTVRANPPGSFGLDFFSALEDYFTEAGDVGLRCVVTGEAADWHHLDGNLFNNDIGNFIPLCGRLHSHLVGLKAGTRKTNLPELEPRRLADELAPRYFREWQIARAYGCACLAFYMGEPPYGDETDDRRILRLCDALYYVRCRHDDHFFAYLIRNSLLRLLSTTDCLDPIAAYRLMLELAPLPMDSGHLQAAEQWLLFSDTEIIKPFESLLEAEGRLSPFARLRRKAELTYNINPEDRSFENLRLRAEEHARSNINSQLALHFVTASRWMRQASREASKQIYETLSPIVDSYKSTVFSNMRLFRSERTNVADLVNIATLCGIASCRLQPLGWKNTADELFHASSRLQEESGHRLSRRFWIPALRETSMQNPKASQLLNASVRGFAGGSDHLTRGDFDRLFRCLMRMRLLPDRKTK